MRRIKWWLCLSVVAVLVGMNAPARAGYHFMQIEQVIGGVNGDLTAQAIQLRLRSGGQIFVTNAKLVVRDAAGNNPISIINPFPANVSNGNSGDRILVTSANFGQYASPMLATNFTMTNLIPSSYLAAGSLTFEDSFSIYWRVSWGGAAYTGSTTGSATNDSDGNFGTPFSGLLPSSNNRALVFAGLSNLSSRTTALDYGLTCGPAVFTNNARNSFTVTIPNPPASPRGDANGDTQFDGLDIAGFVGCLFGTTSGPGCLCADMDGNGIVNAADLTPFVNRVLAG